MYPFKKYIRSIQVIEMRDYIPGENLNGVFVSPKYYPPEDMGMIARLPGNKDHLWYIPRAYFKKYFINS